VEAVDVEARIKADLLVLRKSGQEGALSSIIATPLLEQGDLLDLFSAGSDVDVAVWCGHVGALGLSSVLVSQLKTCSCNSSLC
jgi:hypothetical protein